MFGYACPPRDMDGSLNIGHSASGRTRFRPYAKGAIEEPLLLRQLSVLNISAVSPRVLDSERVRANAFPSRAWITPGVGCPRPIPARQVLRRGKRPASIPIGLFEGHPTIEQKQGRRQKRPTRGQRWGQSEGIGESIRPPRVRDLPARRNCVLQPGSNRALHIMLISLRYAPQVGGD